MISPQERRYLKKWETIRKRKWRFVLGQGVLGWGLPAGALTFLCKMGVGLSPFGLSQLLTDLGGFSLAGIAWGYLLYRGRERRFQQLRPLLKA